MRIQNNELMLTLSREHPWQRQHKFIIYWRWDLPMPLLEKKCYFQFSDVTGVTRSWSCVSGCEGSGTQQPIVVVQPHLTHTANYWSRRHPQPIHSHTNALRGWPFQAMFTHLSEDKLIMGLFMHAVSFCYHPVGTEAPAECWQMLWFWLSSSPSTSGHCCLQLPFIQLLGTTAGNNLRLSDKVESVGV